MGDPVELQFSLADVGDSDRLPYTKSDIMRICQVGPNFAISFYQVDYQAVANGVTQGAMTEPASHLLPVGKMVLDLEGWRQLTSQVEQINAGLAKHGVTA